MFSVFAYRLLAFLVSYYLLKTLIRIALPGRRTLGSILSFGMTTIVAIVAELLVFNDPLRDASFPWALIFVVVLAAWLVHSLERNYGAVAPPWLRHTRKEEAARSARQ